MSNPAVRMEHNVASDEIDLRELILQLWRSRVSIVVVTLVVFLAAGLYAYLATPVYQVRARALPPAAAGLEAYNSAYRLTGTSANILPSRPDERQSPLASGALPAVSPETVYESFIRHVSSMALRRAVFDEHVFPSLSTGQGDDGYGTLWRRFASSVTVEIPEIVLDARTGREQTKDELVTVTITGEQPAVLAEWANAYMKMAIEATQHELIQNLESALATVNKALDDQVSSLRTGALKEREQRILRLQEALLLAESIGLNKPSDAGNLIASYSGETAYLRGADALRSEIQLLKNRQNDDPYIPELTALSVRKALIESVSVAPHEVAVARIDEIATPPVSPIKPRKALILALGLVLGGMLGVFIALVRNMFRND